MNRIILIGNGFDLAHGYPTRYEDFINWYWWSLGKRVYLSNNRSESDDFISFKLKDTTSSRSLYTAWYGNGYTQTYNEYREFVEVAKSWTDICEYKEKSIFFSRICKAIESKGWVDIEKEYYDLLRDAIIYPDTCNYSITDLNKHLNSLKKLLIEYLSSLHFNDKISKAIQLQIYSPLIKNDICISQMNTYYDYIKRLLNNNDLYERILFNIGIDRFDIHYYVERLNRLYCTTQLFSEIEEPELKDLIFPENIMLLNFNYTDIADKYGDKKNATVNHIHGTLNNPESIIFGYGDELDEDYKDLLKQTDNECLKNIKSIKYLESDNYRKMLQFIESAPFQVCIMGHSCGNSDRTLLNTLFEHKNCVSIMPYYYQKDNGSNNYMELAQNICRNFTDMKSMRDRVVNQTFCKPLPQLIKHYIK